MQTPSPDRAERLLWIFAGLALLLGLWARFKGLGKWPMVADEYYVARSVQNILSSGLPAYPCGGYYVRGLTMQYIAAPLQAVGLSAELSTRVLAAISSIIALPALFLLGLRLHGRAVGLLLVIVMSLSAWEIDTARFGRMYAPFQAVFAWYLIAYLRYTVDGHLAAARHMLILTVIGVLTWEGAIFMVLTNLFAPFVRKPAGNLDRNDVRYLALNVLAFVLAYLYTQNELRTLGEQVLPPELVTQRPAIRNALIETRLLDALSADPAWVVVGILVLVLAAAGVRSTWKLACGWPASIALTLALIAALFHQFGAVVFLVAICLLARMISWRDLTSKQAWPFLGTLAASVAVWAAYAASHPDWSASLHVPWDVSSKTLLYLYQFLRFPNFPAMVATPWAWSAPLLGAGLFALIVVSALRTMSRRSPAPHPEQVTVMLVVLYLALISISPTLRLETRYGFFLYPAAIAIAITATFHIVNMTGASGRFSALTAGLLILVALALAGDIQPRRLLAIDSADANFSLGRFHQEKSNLLPRTDSRGAADWLRIHADPSRTLLINAYPTVDFYFPDFDYSYIDPTTERMVAYACQRGTIDRWSNLPLLWNFDQLAEHIAKHERALIVLDTEADPELAKQLSLWGSRVVWTSIDGNIRIAELKPAPHGSRSTE